MIEVNPIRFKFKPYQHQLRGVRTLLNHPVFGLFWKPRLGKSKAIIDTACLLFEAGEIDTCLIVAPAQVRDIWTEPTLGELVTHNWSKAKTYVYREYGTLFVPAHQPCFVASSVEFLRQVGPRNNFPFVEDLLASLSGRRVWFVFDEGSVLGSHKSGNTKAMIALGGGRCVTRKTILDGTPRGNSHLSFYSKFKVLDPMILGCRVFEQFRARYSELVKVPHKWSTDPVTGERKVVKTHMEVLKEKNQEDFARRTAKFCEFLDQDVLDMPKKLPGILTVAMSQKAWKAYCSMRDEMVAELDEGVASVGHAAVKVLRLAQICAGFLGGVQEFAQYGLDGELCAHTGSVLPTPITKEVDDATAEMLMGWLKLKLEEEPDKKVVVWCRFAPEIERLATLLTDAEIVHGVKSGDRDTYNNELHPRSNHSGQYILVCQPQTAQYGNNFSRARTSIFLSQDYNRITRSQAGDRVQADGAGATTLELDVIVTGPKGQKTVVHDIIRCVRELEDAEKRTAADWKKVLTTE